LLTEVHYTILVGIRCYLNSEETIESNSEKGEFYGFERLLSNNTGMAESADILFA